jgi:catechol 2,3-dioxygenase-like lactoylglutathione lyase family enzyme
VSQSLRCAAGEKPTGGVALINSAQFIAVSDEAPVRGVNRVLNVVFLTDDVKAMGKYLRAGNIKVSEQGMPKGLYLTMLDPEGHRISFAQQGVKLAKPPAATPNALRIIHAGFIVRDREKMEHFYKDILGFRPYWHGGMKDDETSWVSLQVPDGTDWLEFMLYDPTGRDKHFLGVMNHIALGVTDIHATQEQLRKNGAPLTEEPKIGRDGKWQLNLYDPDQTRIEFMEFTPVQKPCCSEFTAPHPKP